MCLSVCPGGGVRGVRGGPGGGPGWSRGGSKGGPEGGYEGGPGVVRKPRAVEEASRGETPREVKYFPRWDLERPCATSIIYIELWLPLPQLIGWLVWRLLLSNWSKRLIGRNNYILIGLKNALIVIGRIFNLFWLVEKCCIAQWLNHVWKSGEEEKKSRA